jgi:hypothetical protein
MADQGKKVCLSTQKHTSFARTLYPPPHILTMVFVELNSADKAYVETTFVHAMYNYDFNIEHLEQLNTHDCPPHDNSPVDELSNDENPPNLNTQSDNPAELPPPLAIKPVYMTFSTYKTNLYSKGKISLVLYNRNIYYPTTTPDTGINTSMKEDGALPLFSSLT